MRHGTKLLSISICPMKHGTKLLSDNDASRVRRRIRKKRTGKPISLICLHFVQEALPVEGLFSI